MIPFQVRDFCLLFMRFLRSVRGKTKRLVYIFSEIYTRNVKSFPCADQINTKSIEVLTPLVFFTGTRINFTNLLILDALAHVTYMQRSLYSLGI